jgi:hypothetical protein
MAQIFPQIFTNEFLNTVIQNDTKRMKNLQN